MTSRPPMANSLFACSLRSVVENLPDDQIAPFVTSALADERVRVEALLQLLLNSRSDTITDDDKVEVFGDDDFFNIKFFDLPPRLKLLSKYTFHNLSDRTVSFDGRVVLDFRNYDDAAREAVELTYLNALEQTTGGNIENDDEIDKDCNEIRFGEPEAALERLWDEIEALPHLVTSRPIVREDVDAVYVRKPKMRLRI